MGDGRPAQTGDPLSMWQCSEKDETHLSKSNTRKREKQSYEVRVELEVFYGKWLPGICVYLYAHIYPSSISIHANLNIL